MPPKRNSTLSPVLQAFERCRGSIDESRFASTVLTLIFLRETFEQDWAIFRSHPDDAVWHSGHWEYDRNPLVDITVGSMGDLPYAALMETIDAVESVAGRLGSESAFQLVLEELGSAREMLLTPASVASVLAGTIDLAGASTVYDPFCRAGELLVAAARRTRAESGDGGLAYHGDMPDAKSLAIARMNIRLHQLDGMLEQRWFGTQASTDKRDYQRPEARRFPRILSNPPFNIRNWNRSGPYYEYWRYGTPPKGSANFAWLQYAVERLEPGGRAAIVMANSAAFSMNPSEKEIRMRMVEDGCVEALISLPNALFRGTSISATIWLLSPPGSKRDEILFIDATAAGRLADRTLRVLSDTEVSEIIQVVSNWRAGRSVHIRGEAITCAAVPLSEISRQDYNLSHAGFRTRPYTPPSPAEQLPKIQELMARLEVEHAIARDKDAKAMQAVEDTLP